MWLATQHGFYSIIKKEKVFYIRARSRDDLENLRRVAGLDTEILTWPNADYQYRIIVNKATLQQTMQRVTA